MATRTIAAGGGNWSSNGTWVEGAVPTAADDVVATGSSGNLTIDTAAGVGVCRSLDLTGYVGLLTCSASKEVDIGTSTIPGSAVALKLAGTHTVSISSSFTFKFVATTTGATVTTAGFSLPCTLTFSGVGGGWTLQDAINGTTATSLNWTGGAFHSGNFAITVGTVFGSGSAVRTVDLGTSVLTLGGNGAGYWSFTTVTNLTWSNASSTITCTPNGNATFIGGGLTYGTVNMTPAAGGAITITGANTFGTLNVSPAASSTSTIKFPASTTTTITTFAPAGKAGLPVALNSSTAATSTTLSVAANAVNGNHLNVQDITATGGAVFKAIDSINTSNNSGWLFPQGHIA